MIKDWIDHDILGGNNYVGIFYEYIDEQDFLCHYMVGITIYQTKELAEKALRNEYGNSPDYSIVELEVIG